ncbi:MAG TPA: hypothetical protein VMT22_05010 [Terriglobales bacterium]|nr:hypothetical protein [Terriglobales bacterium]
MTAGSLHKRRRFAANFFLSRENRNILESSAPGGVGSGNPFILSPGTPKERMQVLQEAMRKTYKDPEFAKEYTKLTGLKAEPQKPEELEQTIKDIPRHREAVELFKKLTGPDPLPQR